MGRAPQVGLNWQGLEIAFFILATFKVDAGAVDVDDTVARHPFAVWQANPLDRNAPVVTESRRDALNTIGRRAVTDYLVSHRDGELIMMSMGSLAHYMHDLSFEDFNLRDFLHEGDGDIWKYALGHPHPFAGWIAVEEKAEGGDALYWRGRHDAKFFDGFQRVAEGGGVALYRRVRTR